MHEANNLQALRVLSVALIGLDLAPNEDRENYRWLFESKVLDSEKCRELVASINKLLNEYAFSIPEIRHELCVW